METPAKPEDECLTAETPLDLSVVIPAFNEEGAVRAEVEVVHGILAKSGKRFEIIVVDDGSTDRTAAEAALAPCRLIRQKENRGYGASLKRGIAEAKSDMIVITDADGTYPAEAILQLLAVADDFDMVVGSRTGKEVHVPLSRRPAKWVLTKLASYLAGREIPDLNSGLRLLRRHHVARYERILPSGFSFTTTITLSLLCNDYSVGYVPIDYRKRTGTSKIRPTHAYHFGMLILRVIMLFNPLKIFLPLGALLFVIGLGKFIYDCFKQNLSELAVFGLLGALLIWSIGLLADQNARLALERKGYERR